MSACRHWNDRLLDYALGELSPSAVAEVEAHLRGCPNCAARLAALARTRAQLEPALMEVVARAEPSPDFRARVLAAIDASPARSLRLPAWAGALAAIAIVLFIGVLTPRFTGPDSGAAPEQAPSLSTWRSPTESLLRAPAQDYFRSAPRLGEFYFPLESGPADAGSNHGGNNEG